MILKKITIIGIFFFLSQTMLFADSAHFLDFKLILNKSNAGKEAQQSFKTQLESGFKNLQKQEANLLGEEKKLIEQKKIITPEEYKKKVNELRKKVSSLQKDRNKLLDTVAKQRTKAKKVLLENLNPIVKNYMEEKNIKIVLDKKYILLGDDSFDITKDIMLLLNKKLKSINLN